MSISQGFAFDGWSQGDHERPVINVDTSQSSNKWDVVRKEMKNARIKKEERYQKIKKGRTDTLQLLANRADAELDGRSKYNRARKKNNE